MGFSRSRTWISAPAISAADASSRSSLNPVWGASENASFPPEQPASISPRAITPAPSTIVLCFIFLHPSIVKFHLCLYRIPYPPARYPWGRSERLAFLHQTQRPGAQRYTACFINIIAQLCVISVKPVQTSVCAVIRSLPERLYSADIVPYFLYISTQKKCLPADDIPPAGTQISILLLSAFLICSADSTGKLVCAGGSSLPAGVSL